MEKLNAIIVVIDDDVKFKDDPFLEEAKDIFQEVPFFEDSNKALDYIEQNIDKRLVVVLDLGLTPNMPNGHEVLERIRNISFLVPVIIWSGRDEDKETFADLIQNRAFAFIKKSASTTELLGTLQKAYEYSLDDISGVIEEWIKQHPTEAKNKPFMTSSDGTSYTLNDVLKEIRLQTSLGLDLAKSVNKLTIDLLMRNKEKLQ